MYRRGDDEEDRIVEKAMERASDPVVQRSFAHAEEAFVKEYERRVAAGEIVPSPFEIPLLWRA